MSIAVILLALGLLAGLARGGKLANIGKLHFHYPVLVFVGLGIQIGAEVLAATSVPEMRDDGRGLIILVSSFALLLTFVLLNIRMPGMPVIALGLGLNLLVISLNSGMPVSLDAARTLGISFANYLDSAIKHVRLDSGTLLPLLGDIIPIPIINNIISIGDVVLGIGVFLLVERAVRYQPRRLKGRFGAATPVEER